MRTLVHLSDLHTGRVDPRVADALTRTINGIKPNLIVFSGDLTQRATRTQFREARAFLDALQAPLLVIPGNHDVPLWNVARRFVMPLERYKRYITTDLAPVVEDDEMIVVGVNTARSLAWGEGRINKWQVDAILTRLDAAPRDVIRIIVTHHPFDLPPGVHQGRLLGRARMAMARFAAAGADLFLSGHLHLSHVSHSAERYRWELFRGHLLGSGQTRLERSFLTWNVFLRHPSLPAVMTASDRRVWASRAASIVLKRTARVTHPMA